MLPEVRPSSGVFGETVATEGIPAGIPIAGDAGDQQAALFGQGCFEAGMAKNTYGTGAFLVLNTGDRHVISRRGLLTTLCCDARGRAAYALEGSVFVAGAAVQWLRDEMGLVRTAAETGRSPRASPTLTASTWSPPSRGSARPTGTPEPAAPSWA
jgi:glycerol kinase